MTARPYDDERISAYLDGELDAAQRRDFERDLDATPALAAATAELDELRRALRSLPPVEPPFGFYRRLVRPRRNLALLAARTAAVAAVAVVIALVIGLGSGTRGARVVPALDDYLDQHASAAVGGFTPIDPAVAAAEAPDMAPMPLRAAYTRGEVHQFRYDGGAMGAVSVFVEPGRCDFAKLPAGGSAMTMSSGRAWHMTEMQGRSVVVLDGTLGGEAVVYTVIGEGSADADVLAVATHLGGS